MATKKQRDAAWENAAKMRGKNPDVYRKDDFGNKIYKSSYGKRIGVNHTNIHTIR